MATDGFPWVVNSGVSQIGLTSTNSTIVCSTCSGLLNVKITALLKILSDVGFVAVLVQLRIFVETVFK